MSLVEEYFEGLKEEADKIRKEHPEVIPKVKAQVARFINSRLAYKQRKELQHAST